MALFGEKYGETVRTITIGDEHPFSYELCGGTHVGETGDIGICLITSEGSVAANTRRIEAVTGRKAYELVQNRFNTISQVSRLLASPPDHILEKTTSILDELSEAKKQVNGLRQSLVSTEFEKKLNNPILVKDVNAVVARLNDADADTLRQMVDRFRVKYPEKGIAVLASERDGKPTIIAAITNDLLAHGINAIDLVRYVASPLGGGGGGKPTLAQAGGKDTSQLAAALESVESWVKEKLY